MENCAMSEKKGEVMAKEETQALYLIMRYVTLKEELYVPNK